VWKGMLKRRRHPPHYTSQPASQPPICNHPPITHSPTHPPTVCPPTCIGTHPPIHPPTHKHTHPHTHTLSLSHVGKWGGVQATSSSGMGFASEFANFALKVCLATFLRMWAGLLKCIGLHFCLAMLETCPVLMFLQCLQAPAATLVVAPYGAATSVAARACKHIRMEQVLRITRMMCKPIYI
jgi:hypothetical protein